MGMAAAPAYASLVVAVVVHWEEEVISNINANPFRTKIKLWKRFLVNSNARQIRLNPNLKI